MIDAHTLKDMCKLVYTSFIDVVNIMNYQYDVPFIGQTSIFDVILGAGLVVIIPLAIKKFLL